MLPFWTKGLTEEMAKFAERELGETCENRAKALKEFKDLIDGERAFRPLRDDEFITRFLRAKKYDVKRAFKTYKNYYAYKAQYSGRITDLMPAELMHVLEFGKVFISPNRGANGEGIIMSFLDAIHHVSAEEHFAAGLMAAEIGIDQDATQVCGSSVIFDFRGLSTHQLMRFCSPSYLGILTRGLQNCWPYRINAIHIVKEPYYFSRIYNVFKPLLSRKIRGRIHFHGDDLNSLRKYFCSGTLPTRLGGELGENEFKEFRMKVLQNTPLMERINTYMYENKKYPVSTDNALDINERLLNSLNDS